MGLFVATFAEDQVEKMLGVNDHGELHPNMPQGPEYNDYKMTIHARIIDALDGAAVYNICDIRVSKL